MTAAVPGGALVLGGDYRALGVARSLGRRGIPVWVLAEAGDHLASASRYVQRRLNWPTDGERARVAFLEELADSAGLHGWALIPSGDETAALSARFHQQLELCYTHTVPPWEDFRWTYDKRLTYALAVRMGVRCPHSVWPIENPLATEISFPAVLKPAVKRSINKLTTAKGWAIRDHGELAQRFAEASSLIDPDLLIVQELVPGGGDTQFSYAALCRDGVPLASLTARRTRQYPADFGRASTFVETVECPEVVAPSLRLLRELRYTGLIEIEYKLDPRDGDLKLLDMNPRVWGWHTLSMKAGVDFPWLLWHLISGQEVPPSRSRLGVRWLRLSTDTPMAVKELLGGRLSMREYRRSLRRPRASAIFAWDDPVPGLAEIPLLIYVLASRAWEGRPV
jgi:D-aspartate ligase